MDSTNTTLKSWDINPILDMLHSCSLSTIKSTNNYDDYIATLASASQNVEPVNVQTPTLGDFNDIWRALGQPIDIPSSKSKSSPSTSSVSPSSKSSNTSSFHDSLSTCLEDCSTPYTSQGTDDELPDLPPKKVRIQIDQPKLHKQQNVVTKARPYHEENYDSPTPSSRQAFIKRQTDRLQNDYKLVYPSEFSSESEAEIELDNLRHDISPSHNPFKTHLAAPVFTAPSSVESQTGWLLTPGWVKPVPVQLVSKPPIPPPYLADIQLDPLIIRPRLTLTLAEKKELLVKKLTLTYGMDRGSMLSARRSKTLTQEGGNESETGVHVFVDWSNIVIGFQEALKKARDIPTKAYIKRPPISYSSLALVMERGRPVSRRVLAGSTTSDRILDEMHEAERCGYELNILERVRKARTPKKHYAAGSGYATSGLSSGPEASPPATMGEQAVDELLHMKMLESIVDHMHTPSGTRPTMVVATGDGAAAEYSGGFCKQVGRALQAGWNVELVTWRDQLAYAWKEREFRKRWQKQFSVILLDDFAEELLAIYPDSRYGSGH